VRQLEGWADGGPEVAQRRAWRCLVVLGSHSVGDGGVAGGMATQGPWRWRRHTSLVRRHGVVPCGCETGVCTLFEGSAVLFRGCGVWVVREWVAQCLGADTGHTAQCRTVAGMASPEVLAKQCRDMIPRWGQRDGMAGIAPAGGVGARSPRARRRPAQGGVQPSSEAESRPRGRPALERGGVSVVRHRAPRARRSFARGVSGPTS
jgi:hypothetical protein